MSDIPSKPEYTPSQAIVAVENIGRATIGLGRSALGVIEFVGGMICLLGDTLRWIWRTAILRQARFGFSHLLAQMVRVGIRSIPIICLVQVFIGIILSLQMAPTMKTYGQLEQIATIVAIAMSRELAPLLSGIVLSGFAGAAIAAELGTMVESEEIKALRACALDPVRFLVVPRFLATVIMLTVLTVIADVVGIFGGYLTGTVILDIGSDAYINTTRIAITHKDFLSGVAKAPLFGMLIALIACHEGLSVSGGAEGVGRATTNTVVKCIVALITADVIATSLLYAFGF